LARCSESLKIEETIRKKETIRSKYDVPIPDHNTLWGPIFADMVSQYGSRRFDKTGMAFEENSFPIGGRIEASILNLSQSRRGNKSERRRRSGGSKRQKD